MYKCIINVLIIANISIVNVNINVNVNVNVYVGSQHNVELMKI